MRLVLAAMAAILLATPAAAAEPLRVGIDQSTRVQLSGTARDVVVANPAVADVTMLGGRNLVVLGKRFGVTSVLVVDALGRTIMDRTIVVAAPEGSVSVYRGALGSAYACSPTCEVAAQGDGKAASGPPPAQP